MGSSSALGLPALSSGSSSFCGGRLADLSRNPAAVAVICAGWLRAQHGSVRISDEADMRCSDTLSLLSILNSFSFQLNSDKLCVVFQYQMGLRFCMLSGIQAFFVRICFGLLSSAVCVASCVLTAT